MERETRCREILPFVMRRQGNLQRFKTGQRQGQWRFYYFLVEWPLLSSDAGSRSLPSATRSNTSSQFTKLGREAGKPKGTLPAVGQYESDKAIDKTCRRTRGGQLSKMDRKCFFWESAVKNDLPAPTKYDAKQIPGKITSPRFAAPTTESRVPGKPSPMGPGYYNPSHETTETKVPVYSGSKREEKSFLDEIVNSKDKTPAPGHVGIPDSKVENRAGKALHSARLLLDRQLAPRSIDGAMTAR